MECNDALRTCSELHTLYFMDPDTSSNCNPSCPFKMADFSFPVSVYLDCTVRINELTANNEEVGLGFYVDVLHLE